MTPTISAEQARERVNASLDAIDAAHDELRETSSDLAGNMFRVDVAARLETQERRRPREPVVAPGYRCAI
jgi:hypothetical protein